MRQETRLEKINERIKTAIAAARDHGVHAEYELQDNSVQAELRLSAHHSICMTVDNIHYPKCLDRNAPDETQKIWQEMRSLDSEIRYVATRWRDNHLLTLKTNARSQTGQAKRQAAYLEFGIEQGQAFLAALKKATTKRNIENARREISRLQQAQKDLLPSLRRANSEYLAGRKQAKAEERRRNTEALELGRFWEADHDALKAYFHPPFQKNHLADVSKYWRACLFVECKSTSWKAGRGDWRHKMVGTERAYLCGIDDNGDEWGHECSVYQHIDEHGNLAIEGTVEQAMAGLFGISSRKLSRCSRQGDLLFCPVQIPENTELYPQDEWEVRESHTVSAPGLLRNGRHFRAESDITITHTSHHSVCLQAGSYRLYELQVADAD